MSAPARHRLPAAAALLMLTVTGGSCRNSGAGTSGPGPRAPAGEETPRALELVEVFPHVRVDRKARVVEFEGMVPIDARTPLKGGAMPEVFLEVIACTADSREHEALVVTRARPSHVHAALLLVGMEPGAPGSWSWDGATVTRHAPTGDGVAVTMVWRDEGGREVEVPAESWVANERTGRPLGEGKAGDGLGFVFAGSRMVRWNGREMYDADGTGVLVGLATFGSEAVAWRGVISPESSVEEPEWIADGNRVPPAGTEVLVRLSPAPR